MSYQVTVSGCSKKLELRLKHYTHFRHVLAAALSPAGLTCLTVQTIYRQNVKAETKEAIYNLFAAYVHTMPLDELLEKVERARRDAKLRYVVIYGAACSYCLARAERLEGSYLRTFALELKEQLAQTLAAYVTSILAGPHRANVEKGEPPLRQIIEVLQPVMCTHDAEKLAMAVFEIYEGGYCEGGVESDEIPFEPFGSANLRKSTLGATKE
jgi:hypothetical protein